MTTSPYWVRLRRWCEEWRAFEYMAVEMPRTPRGPTAAGVDAEWKHPGWRYVEVFEHAPADAAVRVMEATGLLEPRGGS